MIAMTKISPKEMELVAGGWLAMVSASLLVPWMLTTLSFLDKASPWVRAIEIVLLAGGTLIFVYIMLVLRRVLIGRYCFFAANPPLIWLLVVNVVAAVLGIIGILFPDTGKAVDPMGMILIVATGLVQVALGVKLLRLPGDLGGLHKPFCYINIVTGVLLSVVILVPLGMITSAVGDVMLGTIFFRLAEEAGGKEG